MKLSTLAILTVASIATIGVGVYIAPQQSVVSNVAAKSDRLPLPQSSSFCDPERKPDDLFAEHLPCMVVPLPRPRPAEADQMDIIVNGKPAFSIDGKPFTPPVVADTADSENGAQQPTFAPFRFPPSELKKQMTPQQRIDHGFAVFE